MRKRNFAKRTVAQRITYIGLHGGHIVELLVTALASFIQIPHGVPGNEHPGEKIAASDRSVQTKDLVKVGTIGHRIFSFRQL
ncbi:MAG: hypothetical protein ACREBQ_12005 [Nitrososphaerales archaeon]